ncbi:glycosyltransferase family 9 protein [bacterium]|nr:glycosyltransferase family 9 protein [bacterium]
MVDDHSAREHQTDYPDRFAYRTIRKKDDYTIQSADRGRFLIIQFRQIGDVLLTLPVAQAIKRERPDSTVGFLVEKAAAPLVKHSPAVDMIYIREPERGLSGDLELLRLIRRERFQVLIDCIKTPSSGWFSLASSIPVRIAFDHRLRRYFYTRTIEPKLMCGYAIDEKLVLLKALGFSPYGSNYRRIDISPDPLSRQHIDSFLKQHGLQDGRPLLAVDPTSKRVTRRWPAEYFVRMIDLFHERRGTHAILIWGPGEEEFVRGLSTQCSTPVTVFCRSTLLELMALLDHCSLFLGNDSAPRHIAVSQGLPTLTIHGATGIGAWTPPEPEHLAFSAQLECQPCNKRECTTLECLRMLKPEAIIDQAVLHFDRFVRSIPVETERNDLS